MLNKKVNAMDFVELIKKYQEQSTPEEMLEVTKVIGKFVARHASEEDMHKLHRDIYGIVSGGHFDKYFADKAIAKMYYVDEDGKKHHAPFYTDEEVREAFELCKDDVSDYTIHDFAVTLNMVRSDNNRFLEKYAKSADHMKSMVIDMTVEWLQDEDSPHADNKIWWYINK